MKRLVFCFFSIFLSISAFTQQQAPLIGIAMPESNIRRWVTDGEVLAAEAKKRGYRAEVRFSNANQQLQNEQIRDFFRMKAKVIIVSCTNSDISSIVNEARLYGITIIAYDRIIRGTDDFDYFITFNCYKVGELQAKSIVDGLKLSNATASNPKYIALFAGSPKDPNASLYYNGAMSILNPYIDKGVLKVVGPYAVTHADSAFQKIATVDWNSYTAKTRMQTLLKSEAANITLDAVLSPNDTIARTLIDVLKEDTKYQGKLPIITGQDAEFFSAVSIKNGEQNSTVFRNTRKLAEAAIILADAIIKGRSPNIPNTVLASSDIMDIAYPNRGNIRTYLLDPILINKDNLHVLGNAGLYEDYQADLFR